MNDNDGVFGVTLGHLWGEVARIRGWMHQVVDGVGEGWVRPHVDSSYSFDRAGEAHAHIEARRSTGQVVLTP
jgi:NADPH:quinone reductase-like Zn-dependent oxidoreductase